MKETSLTKRILTRLNAMPDCYATKIHGGRWTAGQPDILGCIARPGGRGGQAFAIECKVGRNKPTPLQQAMLNHWARSGAMTAVAREDFDVDQFLKTMKE